MRFPGFISGSYQSLSPFLSREECVNLYVETVKGTGPTQMALFGTPGLQLYCTIPDAPGQGMIEIAGRCFAMIGGSLWEIFANASFEKRGDATSPPNGVSMATNSTQLIMACGPRGFCYNLTTNAFTEINDWPGGYSITFLDDYFILANINSRQFNISALGDGTAWDPLDFATKEGAADNLVSVVAVRKELWLLGAETSEIFFDSGNNNFPFAALQGALLEQGAAAVLGEQIVGNSLYWLGMDSLGGAVVYSEQSFTPVRVSTYAVEQEIQKYSTLTDMVSESYSEAGHSFFLMHFPSAGVTWALDTTTGYWAKRGAWDTSIGQYTASLGRFHAFAFGKHLVSDYRTGQIYQQSLSFFDDAGNPIRRLRRSPHITEEDARVRYSRMELFMQRGFAPATGTDADPVVMFRFSFDGGMEFGNEHIVKVGKSGKYSFRAIKRQVGTGRNFVAEASSTSKIQQVWLDAFIRARVGNELQK